MVDELKERDRAKQYVANLSEKVDNIGRMTRSYICYRLVIIVDTSLHTERGQDELREISNIVALSQEVDVNGFGTQILSIIKSLVTDNITSLIKDMKLNCESRGLLNVESSLRCAYEIICLWNGELADFISCWVSANALKIDDLIFLIVQKETGTLLSGVVGGVGMGARMDSIDVTGLLDLANFFEIWDNVYRDYADSGHKGVGGEAKAAQDKIFSPIKIMVQQEYLTRCREQLDEWFQTIYNPDNFKPIQQFSTLFTTLPADVISVLSIHMNVAKDTLRMRKGGTFFMVVGVVLQCVRTHQERHVVNSCTNFNKSVACGNDCLALADKFDEWVDLICVDENDLMTDEEKQSLKEIAGALSAVFIEDGLKSLEIATSFIFEPIVEQLQPELFADYYVQNHKDGEVVRSVCATVDDFRDDLVSFLGGADSYLMGKVGVMVVERAVGFYLCSLLIAAGKDAKEAVGGGTAGGSFMAGGDSGLGGEGGGGGGGGLSQGLSPIRTVRNSLTKRQAFFLYDRARVKWVMERDLALLKEYLVKMLDESFGGEMGENIVKKHFRILDEILALVTLAGDFDWEMDLEMVEVGGMREKIHVIHTILFGASGGVSVPRESVVWDMAEDVFSIVRRQGIGGAKVKGEEERGVKDGRSVGVAMTIYYQLKN